MDEQYPVISLVGGDGNMAVRTWQKAFRPAKIHPGSGVDHLGLIDHDNAVRKVKVQNHGRQGSDNHDMLLYTIELKNGNLLTVLVWNPYTGHNKDHLFERLLWASHQLKPDLMLLQETYHFRNLFSRLKRYERLQGKPGSRGTRESERAETAILVRELHDVLSSRNLRMTQSWSYHVKKGPRQFRTARVEMPSKGVEVRALSFHGPWGSVAGRNLAARLEANTRVARWLSQPERARKKSKR